MRKAEPKVSLYVRVESDLDTAIRNAVRDSPRDYSSISEFVRKAIRNQLSGKGIPSQEQRPGV